MSWTTLFQNFFGNKKEATPVQREIKANAHDPMTEFFSKKYQFSTMLTDKQIALFNAGNNFDKPEQPSITMQRKDGTKVVLPLIIVGKQWSDGRLYEGPHKYKAKMSNESYSELKDTINADIEMNKLSVSKDGLLYS